MELTLDLHPNGNGGENTDRTLPGVIDEAVGIHASRVKISPGTGSGALSKYVLHLVNRKAVKAQHHVVEGHSKNFGRVFGRVAGRRAARRYAPRVAPDGGCRCQPYEVRWPRGQRSSRC